FVEVARDEDSVALVVTDDLQCAVLDRHGDIACCPAEAGGQDAGGHQRHGSVQPPPPPESFEAGETVCRIGYEDHASSCRVATGRSRARRDRNDGSPRTSRPTRLSTAFGTVGTIARDRASAYHPIVIQ